jgi:hypothetical protein
MPGLAGLLFMLQPAFAQLSAQTCDRACLRGMLASYLNALIAHNPKAIPLAPNARFTEETVEKPLGEGLWTPALGSLSLGTFRQDILDVRPTVPGAAQGCYEPDFRDRHHDSAKSGRRNDLSPQ